MLKYTFGKLIFHDLLLSRGEVAVGVPVTLSPLAQLLLDVEDSGYNGFAYLSRSA